MEIRHVGRDDDRNAISNIYEESWKYAYKGIIPQSYLDSIPKGRWIDAVDKPEVYSLVMIDEDKLIGTLSYCKSRFEDMNGFGEIISIYLLPEYIGKGYGRMLLSSAINELYKLGYEKVFLWVLEENNKARRFYEKNDFYSNGKYLEDNIGGKALREVQYVLYKH